MEINPASFSSEEIAYLCNLGLTSSSNVISNLHNDYYYKFKSTESTEMNAHHKLLSFFKWLRGLDKIHLTHAGRKYLGNSHD